MSVPSGPYLKSFQNIEPALRCRPDLGQGTPVARDTRRLAEVKPIWRFQLHPPRFIRLSSRRPDEGKGLTSPSTRRAAVATGSAAISVDIASVLDGNNQH